MKQLAIRLLLLTWLPVLLKAQQVVLHWGYDAAVKQYAVDYLKNAGTIGISVGIAENGKMYQYHLGEAAKGSGAEPDSGTVYAIGSIAKTFAATLLAQAVTDKKCSLQDDIRQYLPDSLNFSGLAYEGHPIRLMHLCNHTSRIPSQLAALPAGWNAFSNEEKYQFKKQYTADSFLKSLEQVRLDTLPGIKYEYSNAAVKLLTLIIERLYQRPYTALLEEYVQQQIGLLHTRVLPDSLGWARFATGQQDRAVLMRTKNIDDFTSGPGVNATLPDMLRYLQFEIAEKNKAVQATHRQTWEHADGIRLGLVWRIEKLPDGEEYYFHSGQGWGCNSFCIFSVKRNTGVVVLVNETTNQKNVIALGNAVFRKILSVKE